MKPSRKSHAIELTIEFISVADDATKSGDRN